MKRRLLFILAFGIVASPIHAQTLPPRRTLSFLPSAFAAHFSMALGVNGLGPYQGIEAEPECQTGTNGRTDTSADAPLCSYRWKNVKLYVSSRGKGKQADLIEVHSLRADETDDVPQSVEEFMTVFEALRELFDRSHTNRENSFLVFKKFLDQRTYEPTGHLPPVATKKK